MHRFLLYHRHGPSDCSATFAAWNGFDGVLRRTEAMSTCTYGGHEIWWWVTAATDREALALLPRYVAERTLAVRVAPIVVP